jgi:hypothetical protein
MLRKLVVGIRHLLILSAVVGTLSFLTPDIKADSPGAPLAPINVTAGTDPNHPLVVSLAPQQINRYTGHIRAGQDRWLAVTVAQNGGEVRQPLELTLFATPGDGNAAHKIHLDLFPGSYASLWSANNLDDIHNFGAGRVVERDGDPLTAELVWQGHLNNNETYFARIRNDNAFNLDYTLFTSDISHTELGASTSARRAVVNVRAGTDPNYPLPLAMSVNEGHLKPGEDRWYTVQLGDRDGETFERLPLTLYFTPNDGNNLHRVHFDVFTADQRPIWSRGDTNAITNMGAGAIVVRDHNPETGELFWEGWLVENDSYYIRVRNSSDSVIDYWLFAHDVYEAQLGALSG